METATAISAESVSPEITSQEIASRYKEIRRRIDRAAAEVGRSPVEIDIIPATKTRTPELIRAAYDAGLRSAGENYVQEALAKQDALASFPDLRWHLIGHLQSNKTNAVAGRFALIHTVDSLRLGERIGAAAYALGHVQDILVQVKLGEEETKSGVPIPDALPLCESLAQTKGVRLRGLMAIAPLAGDSCLVKHPRPYFAQARALFEQLPAKHREILSMGMSGDFEDAVREGATLIRVGTTLFGKR